MFSGESRTKKAEQVLRAIEKQAEEAGFLPIVGPHKGRILVDLVRTHKPKRVLEIGTLVGYSAILMGKELESDAELITIEINPHTAKIAQANIARAELPVRVTVLVGDARKVIPKLAGEFDLVFIDAEKEQYLEYLRLLESKLREGGVVVADNALHAPDYLAYVRSSGKYQTRFISASGGGIAISVKL